MTYPWIERVPIFEIRGGAKLKFPEDRLPRIWAWRSAMMAIPAIFKSFHRPEAHDGLLASRFGPRFYDLDYDYELKK